jgi:NAD(P)-dependent dehydrogenase (short-subunit alcohol dehydrogenase family)
MNSTMEGRKIVVTGASRGLGRGVVEALSARGARVVALARGADALGALARELPGIVTIPGEAQDDALAAKVLVEHAPDAIVLVAGAMPVLGALQDQTWEGFKTNFEVDTKSTFVWLRHALRLPMKKGGHLVVVSSGAAIQGSPVSGGYASAKRAQWFLADYAATESGRLGLGLRVHCVLPALNPSTELGRAGIRAYAERAGVTPEEFAKRFEPVLTPEVMGASIASLLERPESFDKLAYRLGGSGLLPVS